MISNDEIFMRRAIELAREAERAGEVPVGAVIVRGA
jgi:tRNA(adenine34) deaminase